MSLYVFLGPTLPVAEARAIVDARYLPPVASGDVRALFNAEPRPAAIAVIDGFFRTRPAVFHKELLFALDEGVPVYGASSMGALRAAELSAFGMIGVGQVFEDFLAGRLTDDDEVAVAHGSSAEGFAPVSEAMVNIRLGIRRSVEARVLSPSWAERLLTSVKESFYAERSWRFVLDLGRRLGVPSDELAALRSFVMTERPDAKREDAVALLRLLAAQDRPTPPARVGLARSYRFRRLEAEVGRGARYGAALPRGVPIAHLALQAELFADRDRDLLARSLFIHLVEEAAARAAVTVADEEVRALLAARGQPPERAAAARHELLVERLTMRDSPLRGAVDGHVPSALASSPDDVRKHVQSAWDLTARRALAKFDGYVDDAPVSDADLERWYRDSLGGTESLRELAARANVDLADLRDALLVGMLAMPGEKS